MTDTVRAAVEDFRIRRSGNHYTIHQRIGSGWERLADAHPTRADAEEFIRQATA